MQNKITLASLNFGDSARIVDTQTLPSKFYELGFTPGVLVKIQHKAPFNGPICVNLVDNNNLIALRKSEAKLIIVEK